MSKGFMYILKCANNTYYTGSTKNLALRLAQHQAGEGANHTQKRLPVTLVYFEEFNRIDEAFYREKQVQRWRREKKEALINGRFDKLSDLAKNYANSTTSTSSVAESKLASAGSANGLEELPSTSTANVLEELPESVEGDDDG